MFCYRQKRCNSTKNYMKMSDTVILYGGFEGRILLPPGDQQIDYTRYFKREQLNVRSIFSSSSLRVYFSRDYIFCRGDRYVLAYICAKNLNLIIWHLLHMCYPNKNRFILIFSLLTYCANLCLQFANLCLQFRVIIFRQIFDSALPWAICCAGVLFI